MVTVARLVELRVELERCLWVLDLCRVAYVEMICGFTLLLWFRNDDWDCLRAT